jgi:hypothetical protein
LSRRFRPLLLAPLLLLGGCVAAAAVVPDEATLDRPTPCVLPASVSDSVDRTGGEPVSTS